jgi:hypothetical protein
MRESLTPIDDEERMWREPIHHSANSRDIEYLTRDIGRARERDYFGLGKLGLQITIVDHPIIVNPCPINDDAMIASDDLPGDDIRMVLDEREEDMIPRSEDMILDEETSDEIECVGSVIRVGDLMTRDTEVPSDDRLGPIIEIRCIDREIIGATMNIGIGRREELTHPIDDSERLLRARCRVEIDEIWMSREYGEIFFIHSTDLLYRARTTIISFFLLFSQVEELG